MRRAIIIGAGPAGLTAAYELLTKTDIVPIIIEQDSQVGGLSKTINYKGNRIDIGGHRFFSKSERIIHWWLHFLPLEKRSETKGTLELQYQKKAAVIDPDAYEIGEGENIMLVRRRKSRIYFNKKLFDYPLQLNLDTLTKLGILKAGKIFTTYITAKFFKRRPEVNLEDFFINRFGNELYNTFFKDYTEKVWGISCRQIPATWGHQRVKDLDITKALKHALLSIFRTDRTLTQKNSSTSLIEQFLYPKYGPGQMWERVAEEVQKLGGTIHLNTKVIQLHTSNGTCVNAVSCFSHNSGQKITETGDFFLSTMPVRSLVNIISGIVPDSQVLHAAGGLQYRDFIVVGILSKQKAKQKKSDLDDNWIYVQDGSLKAGRIQIFSNWSPAMVNDPENLWIGVEYFCTESDSFWSLSDERIKEEAIKEMTVMEIIDPSDVIDGIVIRVPKAYPSYYGTYDQFALVRRFLDRFDNLYPMGRNGMHKYNNTDHSMLTAMEVVTNIVNGVTDNSNIWDINTDLEYHESKGT